MRSLFKITITDKTLSHTQDIHVLATSTMRAIEIINTELPDNQYFHTKGYVLKTQY